VNEGSRILEKISGGGATYNLVRVDPSLKMYLQAHSGAITLNKGERQGKSKGDEKAQCNRDQRVSFDGKRHGRGIIDKREGQGEL